MDSYRKTNGLTLEELLERQQEASIEAAIRAGDVYKERILSGEGMLTPDEAAVKLGISIDALEKMANARQVLSLKGTHSNYRYPSFQFEDHVLPVIEKVFAAMPDHDPWGIYLFLVQREPLLYPDTPLERIRRGKRKDVLEVAKLLNEAP